MNEQQGKVQEQSSAFENTQTDAHRRRHWGKWEIHISTEAIQNFD